MGMFCPKCGSILMPTEKDGKQVKACSCGYEERGPVEFSEKKETKTEEIPIIEKEEEIHPITNEAECPKCGNREARWWTIQTRSADEPETKFFKCTKCKKTWRDYG